MQEKLIQEAAKNIDRQGETINKLINFLQLGLLFASAAVAVLTFVGVRAVRSWLTKRIDELVVERGKSAIVAFEQEARAMLEALEHELETLKRLPRSASETATPEQAAELHKVSQQAEAKKESERSLPDWFALGLEHYKAGQFKEADQAWKNALKLRPSSFAVMTNLALVAERLERFDEAEAFYARTLDADIRDADVLGNYASFLVNRGRFDEAEALFKRALDADPKHANNRGNYCQLLFEIGRQGEATEQLHAAMNERSIERPLLTELHFYRYAHCPEERANALSELKRLLGEGSNPNGWDFSRNILRAKTDGHPEPELLVALADLISGKTTANDLERFPAWKAA